jgi:hypothetical protein
MGVCRALVDGVSKLASSSPYPARSPFQRDRKRAMSFDPMNVPTDPAANRRCDWPESGGVRMRKHLIAYGLSQVIRLEGLRLSVAHLNATIFEDGGCP